MVPGCGRPRAAARAPGGARPVLRPPCASTGAVGPAHGRAAACMAAPPGPARRAATATRSRTGFTARRRGPNAGRWTALSARCRRRWRGWNAGI